MLPAPERASCGDAARAAVAEPALQALDEEQSEAPEAPEVSEGGREEVGTPPDDAGGVPDPIIATRG